MLLINNELNFIDVEDDVLYVEKLDAEVGTEINIDEVLFIFHLNFNQII